MIKLNNADFEYYLLGCTMKLDDELTKQIFEKLSVDDFTSSLTRKVFKAGYDLYLSNEPVDLINMTNKYLEQNKDAQYGNILDVMTKLEGKVDTTAHAEHYLTKLKELSFRRKVVSSCNATVELMNNENFESLEFMRDRVVSGFDFKIDNSQSDDYELDKQLTRTMQEIEDDYNNGSEHVIPTGFRWLDLYSGGLLNGLTYVGARPSIGKTTFVVNVLNNLVLSGHRVVFFNLEMSVRDVLNKNLSITAKMANSKLRQSWELSDEDWQGLAKSYAQLFKNSKGSYIVDDKYSIEEIINLAREFKAKSDIKLVVIDYLQLIGSNSRIGSRYELVTDVSRKLKLLQKELNIPVWVLAQMSRNSAGKIPELHELKESGAIEQDADRVILLHDPDAQVQQNDIPEVWLNVAKNRFGLRDITGKVKYYKNTQLMAES